jgi:hypothetical protein
MISRPANGAGGLQSSSVRKLTIATKSHWQNRSLWSYARHRLCVYWPPGNEHSHAGSVASLVQVSPSISFAAGQIKARKNDVAQLGNILLDATIQDGYSNVFALRH